MNRALINLPRTARRGDIVEIRVLIAHPMESGFRAGADGALLPRNIITRFTCRYRGVEVFSAEFYPSVAANPFLSFPLIAEESGELLFTWTGDHGFEQSETATLAVE
ncbi:MAG: thiosulfate oxidation carrier complex protein SoxZ [Gammaproteobacteria bacterium]